VSAEITEHVARRVRGAMTELSDQGDALVALGNSLHELADLPGAAEPDQLRHAAVSVSATALRAVVAALTAAVVGERLGTLARVLDVQA
jgi:hypothetical protein